MACSRKDGHSRKRATSSLNSRLTHTFGKLDSAEKRRKACSLSQRKSHLNAVGGKVHNNYRFYICNFTPDWNLSTACKAGGISPMKEKGETERKDVSGNI